MSKLDAGKHLLGHDSDGREILSKKRLDGQRPPRNLEQRINGFANVPKTLQDSSFHKPGSQNRNK